MNRDLKIVLGIFGGLIVLAVGGCGAMVFAISKRQTPTSPAAYASIAKKIATFTVPPGYHIENATDFGFVQSVNLRSGKGRFQRFRIRLDGQALPTDPASQRQSLVLGFRMVAGIVHCKLADRPDDIVKVRGEAVHFSVVACTDPNFGGRFEAGSFSANDATVNVTATALNGPFDDAAFRALLASIR